MIKSACFWEEGMGGAQEGVTNFQCKSFHIVFDFLSHIQYYLHCIKKKTYVHTKKTAG